MPGVLTDPKKLRTPGGFGFLVSWRDRFRDLDEAKASELAERLLDEPGNLAALQQALGQPDATREEIAEWVTGALAAGSMVALRTRRKPPTLDAPTETDLRDLVDPMPGDDEIRPEVTTWLELRVVDELGEPIVGVPIRIRAGDETVVETDAGGIARLEEATTSFGTARVGSASALHDVLRERWSVRREAPWLEVEGKPHLTVSGPAEPLPEVALQAKTPHTLVLQPRVGRVRIVGTVFDTNKAFVLPDALGLLRDVADLYGDHPGSTMLVVGHTDTSGEPDLNLALSLDRARAVSAYLTDDVDAWLAFYEDGVSASQRWGGPEDALLLERALWAQGQVPTGDPVSAYQEARGLTVDGDLGPNTRRALVEDYMSLDGSTLPDSITPVVHGCGESFPLADDGETLDVDPPDGVDDPTDRRVEVLFFDAPMGILPEPPSETSAPGDASYGVWCRRAAYTRDMLVVRPLALAVRVTDEETGEALPGAEIEFADGGLSGKTDRFGVRTFLNVVAGSHHIRAAKPGYGAGAVEHVVLATAAATVIPLALEPERAVRLVLGVRGPDGALIPLPKGVTVSLDPGGGDAVEATTDEGGGISLEASQSTGTATFSISFGETACLTQAPDGTTGLARLDDALVAAEEGTRFIQLPGALELPDPRVVFDDRVPDDAGEFDTSSLIRASRDRPLAVELAPAWEHLTFTFFDRHHGRPRTVPGPVGAGQPALVMTGHVGGSEDAQFHTAWPVHRDGRTMHSLAWFLEQGGVPNETDPIRMRCPERTYVVSSRDSVGELALQVFPSAEAVVDAPNPDRLLHYDLPAHWHCDRYFARRATDDPGSQQPYVNVARQTALASPIIVSLDDIVMMRSDGSGGRTPVPIEGKFTVLDNKLEVYKPNDTDPEGYGEPYFTHQKLLQPAPGARDVPPWLVLDAAGFTRAIVYRQIYDVFDARTTVEDADVPVGARVAYTPFEGDESDEAHSEPFFHMVSRLQIDAPGDPLDPATKLRSGRSRAAILRCCESKAENNEVLSTLQVFRVFLDFSPDGDPPAGAEALNTSKYAGVVAQHGLVLQAQALGRATARWNGNEGRGHQPQLRRPSDGELVSVHAPISTQTPQSVFGETKSHLCKHRVLFQRDDTETDVSQASSDLHVKLWVGVRSSMAGQGASDWDYLDLASHREHFTVAHELGHALGLPDEYGESKTGASMGGIIFADKYVPEGRPYMYDVHNHDDAFPRGSTRRMGTLPSTSSMMTHDGVPRSRHFLQVAQWVRDSLVLPKCVAVHAPGEELTEPEELVSVVFEPEVRRTNVTLGGSSLFDAFLYRVGASTHLGQRFGGAGEAGADALLVLRSKIEIESKGTYGFALRFMPNFQKALQKFAGRMMASVPVRTGREILNVGVVWSPRLLWRNYPIYDGQPDLDVFNNYLSRLTYRDKNSVTFEVRSLMDLDEVEAELRKDLARNLQVQKDHEARLAVFRSSPESDPGGHFSKDTMKRLEAARTREDELREKLRMVEEGKHPQDVPKEEYEALTGAISEEHPPHMVLRTQTAFAVRFVDSDVSPRVAECPTALDTPGIRFRLQCLWAQLFGGSRGRASLTKKQVRALVSVALEGTKYEVVP